MNTPGHGVYLNRRARRRNGSINNVKTVSEDPAGWRARIFFQSAQLIFQVRGSLINRRAVSERGLGARRENHAGL